MSSGAKINANQRRQVESVVYDKPDEYDIDEIKKFLVTLYYPIYHLDFETFQQAVPEYIGCHPYEQIPFQYSLHIEYEDGRLEHLEFLAKEGEDPRRSLAEQLVKDIPMGVCSTAYNMAFEKSVLKHLAEEFPDLSRQHKDMIPNRVSNDYVISLEEARTNYAHLDKAEQDKDTDPMECMLAMLKMYDGLRMYRLN